MLNKSSLLVLFALFSSGCYSRTVEKTVVPAPSEVVVHEKVSPDVVVVEERNPDGTIIRRREVTVTENRY